MEPSAPGSSTEPQTPGSARHPRAFEPVVVIVTVLVSLLGAVIGIHMITTLGVSPNTSVIGAVVAMLIGRIGFLGLRSMRNTNRQNLIQSSISGATFASANSLLTPIAIPFLFGRPDLHHLRAATPQNVGHLLQRRALLTAMGVTVTIMPSRGGPGFKPESVKIQFERDDDQAPLEAIRNLPTDLLEARS